MTIEFWRLRPRRRKGRATTPQGKPKARVRRPKLPIRVGKAQQVLSNAIICSNHELACWLDLAVKTDRVLGTLEELKELRDRLDEVMEPLLETPLPMAP